MVGITVQEFLEQIRSGFSTYADVLINFGAEHVDDFKLLEPTDLPHIEAAYQEKHSPPTLHLRSIMKALHAVVSAEPAAQQHDRSSPAESAPGFPAEGRDRHHQQQPIEINDDESHSEEEDAEWQPEASSDDAQGDPEQHCASEYQQNAARRKRPRAGRHKEELREVAAKEGRSYAFPRKQERTDHGHAVGSQRKVDAMFGRVLPNRHLASSGALTHCTLNDEGEVLQQGMVKECAQGLAQLVKGSQHCLYGQHALLMHGRTATDKVYNLSLLKDYLVSHAFDYSGKPRVHLQCLQAEFGLAHSTVTRYHRAALEKVKDGCINTVTKAQFKEWKLAVEDIVKPMDASLGYHPELYLDSLAEDAQIRVRSTAQVKIMSKADFESNSSLCELDVLPPRDVVVSTKRYLRELPPTAMVTVIMDGSKHGLCGKPSNRALPSREVFRQFVQLHRQPTGRTMQNDGRYHGAEYFLDSQFLSIKQQTGANRKVLPSINVLSSAFAAAIGRSHPHMKAPSDSSVQEWFKQDFGIGSDLHHTTLFPHKTDACSFCESIRLDMQSLEASLRKHRLHVEDAGSIDRQAAVRELNDELAQLQEVLKRHRDEATRAQQLHKQRVSTAREKYMSACKLYFSLLQSFAEEGTLDHNRIASFVDVACQIAFSIDTDYQQDKSYPHWGRSAQPGPTYFMSKVTAYVHLLVSHCCGQAQTPSKLRRNICYMRNQECAGSKDCNDTVFTIFDYLACRPAHCEQPKLFRSGMDDAAVAADIVSTIPTNATLEALVRQVSNMEGLQNVSQADEDLLIASKEVLDVLKNLSDRAGAAEETHFSMQEIVSAAGLLDAGANSKAAERPTTTEAVHLQEMSWVASAARLEQSELCKAIAIVSLSLRPQAFVRCIVHSFDSCSGTNLSQYTSGGYSLALATGVLDGWLQRMMVVGHTKFGPDILANKIANKYNSNDTFNEAHLLEHARHYCSATWYDETLLQDLHEHGLFAPIPGISGFRSIALIADDGSLDGLLGAAEEPPQPMYKGSRADSKYFKCTVIHEAVQQVARRSLMKFVPNFLTHGVGMSGVSSGVALLPDSVTSVRIVRCFVQPKEEDEFYFEIPGYSKFKNNAAGVAAINAALASQVRPARKEYYGQKVRHINEMYQKFVPPMFVPDRFEVSQTGSSGLIDFGALMQGTRTLVPAPAARIALEAQRNAQQDQQPAAAAPATVKRRWNQLVDDALLLQLTQNGTSGPTTAIQWRNLSMKIWNGCEVAQLKSAWKRLKVKTNHQTASPMPVREEDSSRGTGVPQHQVAASGSATDNPPSACAGTGVPQHQVTGSAQATDNRPNSTPLTRAEPSVCPQTEIDPNEDEDDAGDGDFFVLKLHDARFANRRLEVLVEWEGYPDAADYTWEPLPNLPNDRDKVASLKQEWAQQGKQWPAPPKK